MSFRSAPISADEASVLVRARVLRCDMLGDEMLREERPFSWQLGYRLVSANPIPPPAACGDPQTTAVGDLPFVDEHFQPSDAPVEATWSALLRVLRRQAGGPSRLAGLLGCDPLVGTAELTGKLGEALPGFRVVDAHPGRRLELRGRHRFARYSLTFLLSEGGIRARTHAAFPGLLGRLYRAAVVGTGGHRLVTRWILRRIAQAARQPADGSPVALRRPF